MMYFCSHLIQLTSILLRGGAGDRCVTMKKDPLLLDGSVCVGVGKTGDIHNMAETIFLRYVFFHFYMLCLIASLTMDYCLICLRVVCVCSLLYKNMYSLYALFRVGLPEPIYVLAEL